MAGEEGFEPPNGGSKGRCLTTWLLPKAVASLSHEDEPLGDSPDSHSDLQRTHLYNFFTSSINRSLYPSVW